MHEVDDVVREHMREAGCIHKEDSAWGDFCHEHYESRDGWDTDRDECSVIGSAVRAGYRAAIVDVVSDAKDLLAHHRNLQARHPNPYRADGADGWESVARRYATWLPTTTEQDKTND